MTIAGDEFASEKTEGAYSLGADTLVAPPTGVHPNDLSEPLGPGFGSGAPTPPDTAGDRFTTGKPPWKTANKDATPVFERASHDFTVQIVAVNSAIEGGTAIACGRQKGRKSVTLSVPTVLPSGVVPFGVTFAPDQDAVQAGINAAGVLNPGDSVTINTEAPVWLGLIGANLTGWCQVVIEYNPPGGALGGM